MTIGFAHRGAPRSRRDQNTLSAFERALTLGASGLESDIGLTADGVPVLVHAGLSLGRGSRISRLRRHELPPNIPSLADLYQRSGTQFVLSLDMGEPSAADAVIRTAEEYGAADQLWLTYWRLPTLRSWRTRWPHIHLAYATMPFGARRAEKIIAQVTAARIDALNTHHRFCTRGLISRAHEQNVQVFAWGIRSQRPLERMVQRGADAVFCDNVEAMVSLLRGNGHYEAPG